MIYVQFYQQSAISNDIIEACGDRAVIILDGRNSSKIMGQIAKQECIKRKYLGWRIFKGESFTRSKPVSQLWYERPNEGVKNPVWLSAY